MARRQDRQKGRFSRTGPAHNRRLHHASGKGAMTKTEMLETMKRLDAHANALLLIGASDIDLLGGMFDVMPDFKALLDDGEGEERERNAGRFTGLHRYAVLPSNIAEGIADGSIRVPS